jgi:hypothetical protein
MNTCQKISALALACGILLGFSACQSRPPQPEQQAKQHPHGPPPPHFAEAGHHRAVKPLTAEEKQQWQARMQQFQAQRAALDRACVDKAGHSISVEFQGKTIEGQCVISFHPNPPKHAELGPLPAHDDQHQPIAPPPPEQARHPRREVQPLSADQKKQFEAKLQDFKAHRDALDRDCASKVGQSLSVEFEGKRIEGKCLLGFRPKQALPHAAPEHPPEPAVSSTQS